MGARGMGRDHSSGQERKKIISQKGIGVGGIPILADIGGLLGGLLY